MHIEVNNSGKSAGFGYVELASPALAVALLQRLGARDVPVVGRPLRLAAYSEAINHRNPDGSRKRRVRGKKVKKDKPSGGGGGARGGNRRDDGDEED